MDYRELLRKYIDHVGQCEGTVFIAYPDGYSAYRAECERNFTPEELAELVRLAEDPPERAS